MAKSSSKTRTRRSEGLSGEKEVQRRGISERNTKISFDIFRTNTLSTVSQYKSFAKSSSSSNFHKLPF